VSEWRQRASREGAEKMPTAAAGRKGLQFDLRLELAEARRHYLARYYAPR